jgi:type IV pilus assembly protein PilY1
MNKRPPVLVVKRGLVAIVALLVSLVGILPASADVNVIQTPLTKPPSIKPNVMMILDDSGSMAWSVMPDSPSNTDKDKGLISPSVNGVYYNPSTQYDPPYSVTAHPNAETPTFDRYDAPSFDAAWIDGFSHSDGSRNIATYKGDEDTSPINSKPAFSHTFQIQTSGTYDTKPASCSSGTAVFSDPAHPGTCRVADSQPVDCPSGYSRSGGSCVSNQSSQTPTCPSGYKFNNQPSSTTAGQCVKSVEPSCSQGSLTGNSGNWSDATCRVCTGSILGFCYQYQSNASWLRCDNGLMLDSNGLEPHNNNLSDLAYRQCYITNNSGYPKCTSPRVLTGTGAGRTCSYPPATPDCHNHPGYTYDSGAGMCVGTAYVDPQCPNGYNLFGQGTSDVQCRKTISSGKTVYRSLFVYAIKNSDGSYTQHFVGAANEDTSQDSGTFTYSCRVNNRNTTCTGNLPDSGYPGAGTCNDITQNPATNLDTGETFSGGVPVERCHSDDATRQNVANWFSYYRTRILMAKSGLMNAFATLDESIRFGFGSIDGNNNGNVPSPYTSGSPKLSKVKPFGNGSSGTRRQQFWNWVEGSSPNSGTPLRTALKAAGDYYKSDDQPWISGDDAPECNGKTGTALSDCKAQQLSCRQSYTILTTDGFWNSDSITISGSDYKIDGSDYSGDWDGKPGTGSQKSVKHTDPNGVEYIYKAVPPYSGGLAACSGRSCSGTSTLADVAMYYWLADLRPNLADSVPTNTDDPAFWQHMTTFTVGLFDQDTSFSYERTDNGNTGSTTPDDIFAWAKGGPAVQGFDWPTPNGSGNGVIANVSDLVHAGLNGRGGFYAAGNPDAFASGIRDALRRVAQNVGSGASLAANSTKLDTGTTTYQAVYFTGTWKGDLRAFSVNSDGTIATTASWTASEQMPAATDRSIKTCTGDCKGSSKYVDFSTSATFDSKNMLCADPDACISGEANDKINYLRGSTSKDQNNDGPYRSRATPLGDIVDSQPVFVGVPNANLYANKSFSSDYSAFATKEDVLTRRKLLYVAANDGMLHAFNGETSGTDPKPGQEVFAYLPKAVIKSGIKSITRPDYGESGNPHQYFNDGEMVVSDVKIGSDWKTVLVGTTGRGPAKAVYALDVTDPDDITLLWERSAGDGQTNSNYIGRIVGKPVIARVSGGSWVALMGNGYNSAYNKPALLQFDLATGGLSVYNTDTGGSTGDGLSPPAVWISDDTLSENISTQAYAGDLHGNVWAFDLDADGGAGSKIFTAKNSDGTKTLPITAGLVAAKNKADGSVWVFFGTGSVLSTFDVGDGVQTWYGLIVQGTNKVSASTTRADLKKRQIVAENVASDGRLASRGIPPATDGDMAGENPPKGWYIDLLPPSGTAQGERMVTPNQFQGSLLIGTSRLPTGNEDPCNPSGSGWIMAVNPFTGTPADTPFFDINNDGAFTNDAGGDNVTKGNTQYQSGGDNVVAAGVGFSSIANNPIFVGHTMLISFDNAKTGSVNTRGNIGTLKRVSWRELVNQ